MLEVSWDADNEKAFEIDGLLFARKNVTQYVLSSNYYSSYVCFGLPKSEVDWEAFWF